MYTVCNGSCAGAGGKVVFQCTTTARPSDLGPRRCSKVAFKLACWTSLPLSPVTEPQSLGCLLSDCRSADDALRVDVGLAVPGPHQPR